MLKVTQKQIKECLGQPGAVDITKKSYEEVREIKEVEGWLIEFAYSQGLYGCNGAIWRGAKTGTLYIVTSRTASLFAI